MKNVGLSPKGVPLRQLGQLSNAPWSSLVPSGNSRNGSAKGRECADQSRSRVTILSFLHLLISMKEDFCHEEMTWFLWAAGSLWHKGSESRQVWASSDLGSSQGAPLEGGEVVWARAFLQLKRIKEIGIPTKECQRGDQQSIWSLERSTSFCLFSKDHIFSSKDTYFCPTSNIIGDFHSTFLQDSPKGLMYGRSLAARGSIWATSRLQATCLVSPAANSAWFPSKIYQIGDLVTQSIHVWCRIWSNIKSGCWIFLTWAKKQGNSRNTHKKICLKLQLGMRTPLSPRNQPRFFKTF